MNKEDLALLLYNLLCEHHDFATVSGYGCDDEDGDERTGGTWLDGKFYLNDIAEALIARLKETPLA